MSSSSSNARFNRIAISTTNKSVYIARIEGKHTESDVIRIIESARVGRVSYVDFTAVKDNSPDAGPNPAFKFYSAFVMMSEWNANALADMNEFGQVKVWIDSSRTTYFLLRPGKEGSEIPRTKVNIHQLAAYTSELYTKMDAQNKKMEEQAKIIEEQNKKIAELMDMFDVLVKSPKPAKSGDEEFVVLEDSIEMV